MDWGFLPEALQQAIRWYVVVGSTVGLTSFVVLLSFEWERLRSVAERFRYMILCGYIMLSMLISAESLVILDAPFATRHVFRFILTTLMLVTAWMSFQETQDQRKRERQEDG